MFIYKDVITRAIEIVNRRDPPYDWSDHGECCPYCAVSTAKSELDEENGTELTTLDAIRYFFIDLDTDLPLLLAKDAITITCPDVLITSNMNKLDSIQLLQAALKVEIVDSTVRDCPPLMESGKILYD